MYVDQDKVDIAIIYFRKSFEIRESIAKLAKNKKGVKYAKMWECYKFLGKAYEKSNLFKEAIEYLLKYHSFIIETKGETDLETKEYYKIIGNLYSKVNNDKQAEEYMNKGN